ncbi:hypothetical protein IH992_19150 [Candidatus Poribacteria bacterium]|nr:hypothetical protein [Candidatus Poribacteria bacterium]
MTTKFVGVKIPLEIYEQMKNNADLAGISVSGFVRDSIEQRLNKGKTELNGGLGEVKQVFNAFEDQLSTKDKQIEQLGSDLSKQSERHDMIVMQLSKTIESQQMQITDKTLMIEDLRQPKSFWNRLFNGKKRQAKVTT